MISVVIDLPTDTDQTNKQVGLFILKQLPVLERYITIPFRTRHEDPFYYYTTPRSTINTTRVYDVPSDENKNSSTESSLLPAKSGPTTTKVIPTLPQLYNNPFSLLAEDDETTIATPMGPPIEELDNFDPLQIEELLEEDIVNGLPTPILEIITPLKNPSTRPPLTTNPSHSDTTDNLINEMELVSETIDREYAEVISILATDQQSTPEIQTASSIDDYWIIQRNKYDVHILASTKEIDKKYKKITKGNQK